MPSSRAVVSASVHAFRAEAASGCRLPAAGAAAAGEVAVVVAVAAVAAPSASGPTLCEGSSGLTEAGTVAVARGERAEPAVVVAALGSPHGARLPCPPPPAAGVPSSSLAPSLGWHGWGAEGCAPPGRGGGGVSHFF